jgi:hypothetical protein
VRRPEVTENWEGTQITNRLGLWYDEEMRHWALSGKEENLCATGSAGQMVQLAVNILGNLADPPESGPPLGLDEERDALPYRAGDLLASVVETALGDDGEMTEEQRVRFAGGLMAAATHILVSHAQESWTPGWERRFPFRMGLDPSGDSTND